MYVYTLPGANLAFNSFLMFFGMWPATWIICKNPIFVYTMFLTKTKFALLT